MPDSAVCAERPLEQVITVKAGTRITKTFGDAAFKLGAATNGDGKLTYKSSDTNVATVSSAGKVTVKGAGTAKITVGKGLKKNTYTVVIIVKAAGNDNYRAGSKKVILKIRVS